MRYLLLTWMAMNLLTACSQQHADTTQSKSQTQKSMNYNELTSWQKEVILHKATDRPYTGDYYDKKDKGVYVCRQCNNHLYRSDDKFDSHCGWPSFDDEIDGSVISVPDADGMRTEIICANCKGHLGHVFTGEGFTDKNTRHCVNTSSLQFYSSKDVDKIPAVIK